MKKYIILMLFLITPTLLLSQIKGTVHKKGDKNKVLIGASIYWQETLRGTISNENGEFKIDKKANENHLIISFIGYKPDTILINSNKKHIDVKLTEGTEIEAITVTERKKGSFVSNYNPVLTTVITKEGLNKLPCCNLSESFENSAAVDVNYADAVTGAKQINMLGLAGNYTQIMTENLPSIRGLAIPYGLSFIPGTWMESIQISKGVSTVINGFESITGQINVELKKPFDSEKLYLNLYANSESRLESNITTAFPINENLSTMILAHGSINSHQSDMNNDGFMDVPTGNQYNFINRWYYQNENNLEIQLGAKYLNDEKKGGQLSTLSEDFEKLYQTSIENEKTEFFAKLGFPIKGLNQTSIGSMYSYSYHNQNANIGSNQFNASQSSFYTNIILNTFIGNTAHQITTGFSYIFDDYNQNFNLQNNEYIYRIPGSFLQYDYTIPDKLNLILGLRTDYFDLKKWIITPRMHVKYNITDNLIARASAGKGYRISNAIADNISILASSRDVILSSIPEIEDAANVGFSLAYKKEYGNHQIINIVGDYYYTHFFDQLMIDYDNSPQQIIISDLDGKSYSHSFQLDVAWTPIRNLDINSAIRYNDVNITLRNQLYQKPLTAKWKGLLSLTYRTRYDKWQFDITNQFTGKSRIPTTKSNPEAYRLSNFSEPFYTLHVQLTRRFKVWEIYTGAENLTNFKQPRPILAADDPFGKYFDSSLIWGPIAGRMLFIGMRLFI